MTRRDVASHTTARGDDAPGAGAARRAVGRAVGWLETHGFGADEQAALRARLRD